VYKLQIYQIAESNRMENFFVRIGMLCRAPDYTTYFTLIDAGVGGKAVHSDRKKYYLISERPTTAKFSYLVGYLLFG